MNEPSGHVLRQLRELRRVIEEKFAGVNERLDAQREEMNALRGDVNRLRETTRVEFASMRAAIGQDVAMIEDHEDRLKALEK